MTQKTRSLVTLGGLLVLALAAGAWAWWGVHLADEEEAARADAAERLVEMARDEVRLLEIEAGGESTRLEKRDGEWRLLAPVRAAADRGAVETLLDRLDSARRARTLEVEDPAKYGLDAPGVRVAIQDAAGKREEVAIGASNDFDGSVFVRDAQRKVVTAPGSLRTALDKRPFHLRDKRIVVFGADALASLELSGGVRLERQEGSWMLVGDARERADEEEVESLIRALQDLRATAFAAEEPEDLAPFGLDDPRLRIELQLEQGEPLSLAFGERDGKAFVRLGEGPVAEIASSIWEKLEKDHDTLRDRRLFSYDSSQVARVVVEKDGGRLELERGPDGWRIPDDPQAQVMTWRAAAVVSTLRSLRAEEFAPLGAVPEDHGLDDPSATVVALDAEGGEVARLLVGSRDGTRIWVQAAGAPRFALLRALELENVLVDRDAVVENEGGDTSEQATAASGN